MAPLVALAAPAAPVVVLEALEALEALEGQGAPAVLAAGKNGFDATALCVLNVGLKPTHPICDTILIVGSVAWRKRGLLSGLGPLLLWPRRRDGYDVVLRLGVSCMGFRRCLFHCCIDILDCLQAIRWSSYERNLVASSSSFLDLLSTSCVGFLAILL